MPARADATCLVNAGATLPPTLIDHGTGDQFLAEQLFPGNLEAACAKTWHAADVTNAGGP